MKKHLYVVLLALVFSPLLIQTVDAQSTEGTDFWVTMMRADSDNPSELSLTVSAKNAANVTVSNPYTGYTTTFSVASNGIYRLENLSKNDCYVGSEVEEVSRHALHVVSDNPISLIAANYRDKSFDVAAVLPTAAVRSEYRIMCYTPTAHSDGAQGTHFAIVATEDNTVVDITPTVQTYRHQAGVTFQSDTLQRGEVYYVWTGNGSGDNYDLSGTIVKAQSNKKIAVFNGNPHTNIPNAIRDRDHIYSQAMPIQYWGTQFAIMSSVTTIDGQTGVWERIDKIRVMALTDETVVYIDGDSITTIDFASNPKGIYEFDFGAKDQMTSYSTQSGIRYFEGSSHFIETSCPAAVHQFFTSDRYDHSSGKYCNGDPSELWVNPIEQNIEEITFATFQTQQVKDHFINIVTKKENVSSLTLDGNNISSRFKPLTGNAAYSFARMDITDGTHTLKADSGFIANVYGFGEKESYAFPAGAYAKDLTSAIIINGDTFSIDKPNTLCGNDTIHFECNLNYVPEAFVWGFGDGMDTTIVNTEHSTRSAVDHYYSKVGAYPAYVLVRREHDATCYGQADIDSIPVNVTIGRLEFEVGVLEIPCGENAKGKLPYTNISGIDLTGAGTQLGFDAAAKADGFKDSEISIQDGYFEFVIPATLTDEQRLNNTYALNLRIETKCDTLDKNLEFNVPLSSDVIDQRYSYALGLKTSSFKNCTLTNFQWKNAADSSDVAGQVSAVLNLKDVEDKTGEYFVCYDILRIGNTQSERKCSCPKAFGAEEKDDYQFQGDVDGVEPGFSLDANGAFFVNANSQATAAWIDINGNTLASYEIPAGGCTIQAPKTHGFYVLRVTTGKKDRNFKVIVNQ